MLYSKIHTTFGWTVHAGPMTNARSLRNFARAQKTIIGICVLLSGFRFADELRDIVPELARHFIIEVDHVARLIVFVTDIP